MASIVPEQVVNNMYPTPRPVAYYGCVMHGRGSLTIKTATLDY
ncbi:hypothetical protein NTE_02438 [Candidatus Nitrososphaera evergladensis SR1]|uniref:Uncharacterized protein n=1 Tax=Candidatus Nitrososphaera evergladensis SR1 TaxID=1459636 RepID=A0A075MTM9_9ARCH|nr:hypothetical protein NTE_02438 [Candidatus Nitrososphaera evergladensis SR1]